jgi:transcriptional regulator with XRE-family HTH domain
MDIDKNNNQKTRDVFVASPKSKPNDTFQIIKLQVADAISSELATRGWNQKDLASELGKSPSEVSKWLNEKHNITLDTLLKLLGVFNLTLQVEAVSSRTLISESTYTYKKNAHVIKKRFNAVNKIISKNRLVSQARNQIAAEITQ